MLRTCSQRECSWREVYESSGSIRAFNRRRFALARSRSGEPISPFLTQFPIVLSAPTNAIFEGDRTIYEYAGSQFQLHFDGGAIVGTAKLQLLFWGEFWIGATGASRDDLQTAAAEILASPYLSELNQNGFQGLTLNELMVVIDPGPPFPNVIVKPAP
jgi:hypothetical protein